MLRAAVLAAIVAVLGGALYVLSSADEPRSARSKAPKKGEGEVVAKSSGKTRTVTETPGLRELVNRPSPVGQRGHVYEPPAITEDPGRPKNQAEVVSRFETFIADLEAIRQASPKMSRADKERIYKESTAMLAAMTEQFDVSDPDQARYLEEARVLMLNQLNQLGVGPSQPEARPTRQRNPPPQ